MSPFGLHNELKRIGETLTRWQAEAQGLLWLSAALTGLWLCAFADLFLRYERVGRLISSGFLAAILGAGLWQVFATLRKKGSIQAIAARVERAFPVLDNYLINVVQFELRGPGSPLEAVYVERGVPDWHTVNVKAMRNRREWFRDCILLCVACLLLISTGAWTGAAWTNAMARILNPFSPRPPTTLATLHHVAPGHATVFIGNPLTLSCEASGKNGQNVFLDLWPADDKKSVMQLGRLIGNERETYFYRLSKVTTAFQYRFHVGDAVSERYAIRALVPLAFNKLGVTIAPPAYTRLETRSFDALFDTVPVPQGSVMTATLQCNRELRSASLIMSNAEPVQLTSEDGGKTWKGRLTLTARNPCLITARDANQAEIETALSYDLLPDKPPTIRVVAPTVKTVLAPGAAPSIQFEVADDFGITSIRLEKVSLDERNPAPPVVMQQWAIPEHARQFATNWAGDASPFNIKEPLAFRLVAMDNCAANEPNRAESAPIVFDWNSAGEIQAQTKATADQAADTLNTLVELQHANLEKTRALDAALATTGSTPWQDAATAQTTILNLAGQLIANPRKPLGPLTEPVRALHRGAMQEVIDVLQRVPQAEPARKSALSQQAILLETGILRILTRMNDGMDKVKEHRKITGLLPLLDALVKGQETALDTTRACVVKPNELSDALIQKQDRLATDTGAFTQSCRTDSKSQSATDKEFSALLIRIADGLDSRQVSANMLRAAEQLQNKAPALAIPLQTEALAALKEFQKLLNEWRVADAAKTMSELSDALRAASQKLDKLAKIETKALEAVRETSRQEDKDNKKTDALEEDFEDELNKINESAKDALLQVATDLQIFPELPVGNDLVEDVFQVFEDCKQATGSEKTTHLELGLQKEDLILKNIEALQNAKDRIDDTEFWLNAKPGSTKRNMENFDQQEMVKYPIIPMPAEMEDIIGDLLKRETEVEKDSASNQGVADALFGWDIKEGEQAGFSAKGKSGNEPPAHKDQDGRGNIGRQGMSDGETTAGSGKINEGDENIDKRMTQDASQSGQVQEDGHAKAKATGGGKQSGFSEELGMSGSGPRRDATTKQGSELGLQAMLRRNAQAVYARAQLSHIRTGSLDEVIRHMQQAENAIANGAPIRQVREFQRLAIAALKKTQTELGADVMTEVELKTTRPVLEEDQLAGARDEAPANYRDMVSDYFKALTISP